MTLVDSPTAIDPRHFRNVLGGYPTGVSIITAKDDVGRHAMVVGTFTSISLNPPLVGFFPDRASSSWPKIERAGRFCVNVLAANQLELSGRFAGKADDKFAGIAHGNSPSGQPLLDGVIAWLDCRIVGVQSVGDHFLVVGAVEALDKTSGESPLLFHGGGYHRLQSLS